jgi:dCMP deaminase
MTRIEKPELGPRAEWPTVGLAIAKAIASRSKDATTRVGAVVTTLDNQVIGLGYNGNPRGSSDDLPVSGPKRHLFVVHAEVNAALRAIASTGKIDLQFCTVYSTHRPCASCLKFLAHLGIRMVWYGVDELSTDQSTDALSVENALYVEVRRVN